MGAEDGEGAEQGGAVVVVGDGFEWFAKLTVRGEGLEQSSEVRGLMHRSNPEEVGSVAFGSEVGEGGVGEEDGQEGVGEDFEDAGRVDGVGMGGLGEGEVSLVLESEGEFGEEGGVEVEALAGGGAGGAGLAAPGEDAAGE